jgi:hypothetical protein
MTPLLFSGADKRLALARKKQEGARKGARTVAPSIIQTPSASASADMAFPMYLVPLNHLLSLKYLLPFQEMLQKGLLVELDESMLGKILFVR